ncbi:MAG: fumarylacetoacetate hydrolase family protein [candidate division Zixibacteria bacterium]|nr:fumarylacetoacetate hydrolase family protein [candidate division Zixibacteria bacterium]
MQLVSYLSPDGESRAGLYNLNGARTIYDISAAAASLGVSLPSDMTELLMYDGGLEITRNIAPRIASFPSLTIEQVTLLAPVPYPGKILALAGNYQAHIQEGGGAAVNKQAITPRVFIKPGTCVIGPEEAIVLPHWSHTVDYELELSIVIGAEGRYIDMDDAGAFIAGYMVSNDVSARSLTIAEGREKRTMDEFFDWLNGKWFDTFGAFGPLLVTPDEVGDPHNLHMQLSVNGEVRQDASTAQMIFNCYEIVSFCSYLMTLEPGDIIMTGTPSGVGDATGTYLRPGDVVEAEIERLGSLVNTVEEEGTGDEDYE